MILYGTAWKEDRTRELTRLALGVGFRGIDTANQRKHYVEAAVGEAIADAGVPRAELFLQTKFTFARGQDHRIPYDPKAPFEEQVARSFASSLEHLKTTYVDAYVLHGPSTGRGLADADREVWAAMTKLHRAGQARALGVSNVSLEQLAAFLELDVRPSFVQNRCYARTGWDREVRALCAANRVVYQGFSLLTANGRELGSPAIARIAARTGRTIPQLVFAFALRAGMMPLTGTSSEAHMREDLAAADLPLDDADHASIDRIGGDAR
jgi:diketogulonate reductase-like aldo/keto reductase